MKRLLQISAMMLVLMMLLFWLAHATGWLQDSGVEAWLQNLRDNPNGRLFVALAVVVLLVADLFLPVPSSIVMTAAGSFAGFALGFCANLLGSLLGACLGYALCRRFGRPFFLRVTSPDDLARAEKFWTRYGGWGVALSRPLPMLAQIIACFAGLLRMKLLPFLGFVLLGAIPLSAFYAWAGQRGMATGGGWAFLLALAVTALGFSAFEIRNKLKGKP